MSDFQPLTDAELVTAFRAGDSDAFAGIYDRYADRIYSYCLAMLRSPDDAADAAQDAFVNAATRIGQLESPEKLRPWLFAVARNEAHSQGRRRARVTPKEDLSAMLVDDPDLAMGVKQEELRELVWAAADGLGERDQQLLALHLTEGLEGEDLAAAIGVETSHVHVMVSRMKDRVEKALGALLIARLGSEECDELEKVLGEWDGSFSMEVRSRVTRHIEGCDICRERRACLLAPANMLPGIMVVPAPAALRERVLGRVEKGGGSFPVSSEMAKIGMFAAVTLVIGLIGFAVSAQFDPLDPPPAAPVGAPAAVVSTTTADAASATSTTAGAGATSSSAPPAAPANIQVSVDSIDFGADGTTAGFDLSNSGGQPGGWAVEASSEAISFSSAEGEVAPGAAETIQVSLDRTLVDEGDLAEVLTIAWSGGESAIAVVGIHEDLPVIHNPRATPAEVNVDGGPDCLQTQTTVSARVRDSSPLETVLVRWSPDGGAARETEMILVGDDMFESVIGPFTTAHTAEVRVVAFDDRGNAGGATFPLDVIACP